MKCPNCHTRNDPNARFCMNCGASLAQAITSPAKPTHRLLRLVVAIVGGLVVGFVAFILYWFFISQRSGEVVTIDPKVGGILSLVNGAQLTLSPEMNADGSDQRKIVDGSQPAWRPASR